MADNSRIEWTDATWNPIRARNRVTGKIGWHCEHDTPGCKFCYSGAFNKRLGTGLPFKPGHRADIEIFLDEAMLLAPLRWKKPRKIFVCSMTDLFASFVPDEWIDRIFAVMALAPQHTFQVLTKRSARMRAYVTELRETARWLAFRSPFDQERNAFDPFADTTFETVFAHIWLGVSAEDQTRADERIPDLLATPAAVRFVSAEPLLGPINLRMLQIGETRVDSLTGDVQSRRRYPDDGKGDYQPRGALNTRLDWIIAGGESGPKARPMHPDWARSIRDQCAAAGVAFHFKQWGAWAPGESINDLPTRTEIGATLEENGEWSRCRITPRESEEMHCDDEPDVYCVGKARAGRLLDGVEHNAFPEARS